MPCADVTETIKIVLDKDERLVSYSLQKRTCGGNVGDSSFILDRFHGQKVEEIILKPFENFPDTPEHSSNVFDYAHEFLFVKHFLALQSALAAFLGEKSQARIDFIRHTSLGTEISAMIPVNILTSEIQSCGNCTGCGSRACDFKRP